MSQRSENLDESLFFVNTLVTFAFTKTGNYRLSACLMSGSDERECALRTSEMANVRIFSGRGQRLVRAGVAVAFAIGGASVLAACGGPSAAQSANTTLTAGITAQRAGDYGTATTDYEKVLSIQPKNQYALYDLGDVEQFQHQSAAAETHYKQALVINPKFENALYNLAILETPSDPAGAKALYLQVIAITPQDAVARLNLGRVLLTLGLKKAGDAQINLAVKIQPNLKSQAPPNS